nr:pyridoxal-dependent decarboxylase [Chitinophagales bacterium]
MLTELRDDKWKALLDLLQHYYSALSDQSVKPQVVPGSVYASLPEQLPDTPESFEKVLSDTRQLIMPALTHWQHPGFMALFPSNSSFPSLAGEVISSGVAINAMMWDTSPAATELEQRMMEWLRDLCGLPS